MIDPVSRAQRWRSFIEEDGGLNDIFTDIERAYVDRLSDVEPWETDKLRTLAIARKVTASVRAHVQAIIDHGTSEALNREHADRIAKLPVAKRKWI